MPTHEIYNNADQIDYMGNIFNISSHDGSTHGLQLGGVLVTLTGSELNNGGGDVSVRLVNQTASTMTPSQVTHDSRIITLNRAAGIAVTLPAATGSGMRLTFIIGTTITSNTTTFTAAGADTIGGFQTIVKTGTTTANVYPITITSTVLTLNGTTKGGIIGDKIEFLDLASAQWIATETLQGSGALESNFT